MFAGSCIGVILLVMLLELLRRAAKEYDAFLVRGRRSRLESGSRTRLVTSTEDANTRDSINKTGSTAAATVGSNAISFSPNMLEQAIRAFLHMSQFAVAYIVMLLAM
jgi:solute carrier family 31 (copper transporter), member 1